MVGQLVIVTAALAWWNEQPADLERCVRSLANIANRIVAVDGSYRRYPGATVTSPPEQADTIRRTALAVGIDPIIHVPKRLWAGQVEKRDFLMRSASHFADWIAVVDADFEIIANRDVVRRELEAYGPEVDVVRVVIETPPGKGEYASHWHRHAEEWKSEELEHFFRALPEMSVERVHWQYGAVKDGEPVWMFGPDKVTRRRLPSVLLGSYRDYRIRHWTLQRSSDQIQASRAFLNDREWVMAKTCQEDDQPGLPQPAWNYDRLAFE